jgi:hypothetical protein
MYTYTYTICSAQDFIAYILNRPPLLCVNIYAYVKQRAEDSMLGICPGIAGQRDSRSGGQPGYKSVHSSLSSLVKIVGKATIYLGPCLFSK